MTNDDTQKRLAAHIKVLQERIANPSKGIGYPTIAKNGEMDVLSEAIAEYAKPPADYKHIKKAEKFDSKATLLGLCARLEELCPYKVMPNSWLGDVVPSWPSGETGIRDNITRLKKAREELAAYPTIDAGRRDLKDRLRADSEGYVETMRTEMARLREEMQPLHARTIFLSDHEIEPVIQFARAFVEAVNEDRKKGSLKRLPAIDGVARKTECYLAMLDYVKAVEAIAPEMRSEPKALWNKDAYEAQLIAASDAFRKADFKQAPTTTQAVKEFNKQDNIIRNARTAKEAKVASECLKHLALEFIAGGVAMEEIERSEKVKAEKKAGKTVHENGKKLPTRTREHKLFSRISDAHLKDVEPIKKEMREFEARARSDRRRADGAEPPINDADLPTKTNDLVFAARWALQAEKLRFIVGKKHGMLADPAIDTFQEASPHVSEIRRISKVRAPRARKEGVEEGTVASGDISFVARAAQSQPKGRSGRGGDD